ncbi:MAG: lipoyl(octanoyl) transferase LipB [Planctomycetota bacterium JB042]
MSRPLEVVRLGRRPYDEVRDLQLEAVERRAAGDGPDRLFLVEHDPVVTVGRGAGLEAAAGVGVPVVRVERGGEATWHGPGQLVGYPILRLEDGERDLHRYLRDLEEALIRALADLGVAATRNPPHTGVWSGGRKLASIGVAVRRWVTYHGFALNVDCDLRSFEGFAPCGLDAAVMSSVAAASGGPVDAARVEERVVLRFLEVFGRVRAG